MKRLVRILRDGATAFAILSLIWLIAAKLETATLRVERGAFSVVDGDTLARDGQRLRLQGIDAPELAQSCGAAHGDWACGQAARAQLAALVAGAATACSGRANDRYQRLLVTCRRGAQDLNAAMVAAGMAVASGDYAGEEAAARAARRGIWAGDFERPADWRHRHGTGQADRRGAAVWSRLRAVLGID